MSASKPLGSPQKCRCDTLNAHNDNFCKTCGANLSTPETCLECGEKLDTDAIFCPKCGKPASTGPRHPKSAESTMTLARATEIKRIKEKLTDIGIDNLVTQILDAFEEEYPWYALYARVRDFPRQFFDVYWARQYGIWPRLSDFEIRRIMTEVEGKVMLEYVQQKSLASRQFEEKSVDVLVREAWRYLEARLALIKSQNHLWMILNGFWQENYPEPFAGLDEVKKTKVTNAVYERWLKKQLDTYYKSLSPKEKERAQPLKEFLEKTPEQLAEEIVSFFEKKQHWPAVLDRSPQRERAKAIIEKLWSKFFPPDLIRASWIEYAHHSKWLQVVSLVNSRLPEMEKQIYNHILQEILKLAKTENRTSVKRGEIDRMLGMIGLTDIPQHSKKNLCHDVDKILAQANLDSEDGF